MASTQETVDRAKRMLLQTQAQGNTPFAGSSYDVPYTPTRTIAGVPSNVSIQPEAPVSQPSSDIGLKLIDLLKQYQTLGTKPFQEKAIAGQQEQVTRSQTTPDELIGASPQLQGQVRNASVSAVEPTIQGAEQQGKTFGEQLNSFGNTVKTVQDFLKQADESARQKQHDAVDFILKSYGTFGSGAFSGTDPKELSTLEKTAGLPAGWIEGRGKSLKEQEMVQKAQIDEQNRIARQQIAAQKSGDTVADPQKAQTQLALVEDSLQKAKELAHASGRSGLRKTAEGLVMGSTDYTNLVAITNTLRTNVLTLATDPSIKKFFGPQMSNADVQLMTSAGTTLNPELQSPKAMLDEITRLEGLVSKLKGVSTDQIPKVSQSVNNQNVDSILSKYGL